MITVRVLEPEDAPLVWDLLYHALHVPAGHPPFPLSIVREPALSRYADAGGRPNDHGLVALGGEEPLGGAWLRLFTAEEPGFGFVDALTPELSVAVLPRHRGRGIGTSLVHGLLAVAREHFLAVSLSVSTTNPAVRLYERLGFTLLAQRDSSFVMIQRWA